MLTWLRSYYRSGWAQLVVYILLATITIGLMADHRRVIHHNCQQIEQLKKFVRQVSVYDPVNTRTTLLDLGIDPNSKAGKRLIRGAKTRAAGIQEKFAARSC